jgi:predicted N-acetyltransferase YhbS
MLIRPAREDDADQLAQAEYDTAAGQEGLLAAKPFEIPVDAFRLKIRELAENGLYVVMEDDQGHIVGHLLLEPLSLASTRHVAQLTVVIHPGYTRKGYGRQLIKHAIGWARRSEVLE